MSTKMLPIFNWFGGRRLSMCLGSAFICTALIWFGKIDGNIYRDLILGTVGLYIAGNTAEAIKGASKSATTSESDSAAG